MITVLSWGLVIVLAWVALFAALLPVSWLLSEVIMERILGPLLDWSLDADGIASEFLRASLATTGVILTLIAWAAVLVAAIAICEAPVFILGEWILL